MRVYLLRTTSINPKDIASRTCVLSGLALDVQGHNFVVTRDVEKKHCINLDDMFVIELVDDDGITVSNKVVKIQSFSSKQTQPNVYEFYLNPTSI